QLLPQLAHTAELREQLFQEIKGRLPEREQSAAYRHDGYWYYHRFAEGQEHPLLCRRPGDMAAPEQLMLDLNVLAEGHSFCQLMGSSVSPDGRYLAYVIDYLGRRIGQLRIRDLDTGDDLPEVIEGVSGNLVWAMDGHTLLYGRKDPETLRPHQIYRHRRGSEPAADVLVFEETDDTFRCGVGRSQSRQYLVIQSSSTLTSEVRLCPADQPEAAWEVFQPRTRGHEYSLDHLNGQFFILSNAEGATNFQIFACPEADHRREAWTVHLAHREDQLIEDFTLMRDYMAVQLRRGGLTHLEVLPFGEGEAFPIVFPDPIYSAYLDYNPDPDSPSLRYGYESMTTPASLYDLHIASREASLAWQKEIRGGFSAEQYRSERRFATAPDGTEVPISLVYRADTPLDGTAPLLLYGYGAYGYSLDPYFSPARLSLLDRGFIFAMAHVRGGEENGRPWYEAGRQMQKRNSFTDFIACGEALLAAGLTRSDRLFAMGGSAGGLLVGAVINMRPDLFAGVVAQVPFVDVITTMLDDSIPLTTGEYDEWGNPHEPEAYRYILSYSPYDNVEKKAYPHLLVTTGLHDSQVQYWEPAKWVAKLRTHQTADRRLLLYTNMDAGHGGASGRFEPYREVALEYAFLLDLVP
ncbi:MAG: S9 family peptidase, partial [Bacteroidetes bacterium]